MTIDPNGEMLRATRETQGVPVDAVPRAEKPTTEALDAKLAACPFCGLDETEVYERKERQFGRWQAYCDGCGSNSSGYGSKAEAIAAWNRRAATRAGEVSEPVVKALEWEEVTAARSNEDPTHEPTGDYEAVSPIGVYYIEQYFGSDSYGWRVTLNGCDDVADKDDPAQAKAAAQADYDRRIRSALASPSYAQPAPHGEPLCEDEGCDHFGTPHVCLNKPAPRADLVEAALLSDFTDAFMLCVVGDGAPYIKVQFSDIKRAQDFHSALINEMGRRAIRPFKGVAREGIEAQNGLNDTYAGDPYP